MTNQSNQMAVMQKDITDQVSNRISQLQDDGLALPKDYNPQNALKAAWFKLQQTCNAGLIDQHCKSAHGHQLPMHC